MNKFFIDASGVLTHFIGEELRATVPAANVKEYPPHVDHLKALKRAAATAGGVARATKRPATAGGVDTAKPRKKTK